MLEAHVAYSLIDIFKSDTLLLRRGTCGTGPLVERDRCSLWGSDGARLDGQVFAL